MTEQSENQHIGRSFEPWEAYEERARDEIGQPTAKFKDLFATSRETRGQSTQSNSLQLLGTSVPRLVYRMDRRHSPKNIHPRDKWTFTRRIILWESLGKTKQLIFRFMNFLKKGR